MNVGMLGRAHLGAKRLASSSSGSSRRRPHRARPQRANPAKGLSGFLLYDMTVSPVIGLAGLLALCVSVCVLCARDCDGIFWRPVVGSKNALIFMRCVALLILTRGDCILTEHVAPLALSLTQCDHAIMLTGSYANSS